MSRSKRRTPKTGITTAASDKAFKTAEHRRERRAQTAMHTFTNGEIGDPFLKVIASNLGHRDVTISNLGIEIGGGQTLALLDQDTFYGDKDTPIPTRLSDGEMAHRYYPYSWISSALWNGGVKRRTKIKPFVVDTAGQRHYGKAMTWDPTQFRQGQ